MEQRVAPDLSVTPSREEEPVLVGKTSKRVLLVTTAFPPNGTSGRFRPLRLVRLLPQYGWDVTVLTSSPEIRSDPRINDEIPPNARVVRAWLPQLRDRLITWGKRWLGVDQVEATTGRTAITRGRDPAWRRCARLVSSWSAAVGRYCMIPDIHMPWIPFAVLQGVKVCRRWDPDVILTTAPTFSTFLVGCLLKRITGIPWVADYRDLWTGDVLRQWVPPSRARLELLLERFLYRRADMILTVSEGYRQRLLSLHREQRFDRLRWVPNGAALLDMGNGGLNNLPSAPGTFVYTGYLYDSRNPVEFFEAFALLATENSVGPIRPRCILAGRIEPSVRETLERVVSRRRDGMSPFELPGALPHLEALRLQRSAFALLLFVNVGSQTEGTIPAKLFEYIAARRPILAITENGDVAEIVQRGRLGWVTKPDTMAIHSLLGKILVDPRETVRQAYQPDWQYLSQFDERVIASRVACALTTASASRRVRSRDA